MSMPSWLIHASAWSEDAQLAEARERLRVLEQHPPPYRPLGWAFALYLRMRQDDVLAPAVVGVTTETDSFALTHVMIEALPAPLYLYGGRFEVEILPLCGVPALRMEPVPGVLIRTTRHAGEEQDATAAMSARDLRDDPLVLTTTLLTPPPGWPR